MFLSTATDAFWRGCAENCAQTFGVFFCNLSGSEKCEGEPPIFFGGGHDLQCAKYPHGACTGSGAPPKSTQQNTETQSRNLLDPNIRSLHETTSYLALRILAAEIGILGKQGNHPVIRLHVMGILRIPTVESKPPLESLTSIVFRLAVMLLPGGLTSRLLACHFTNTSTGNFMSRLE